MDLKRTEKRVSAEVQSSNPYNRGNSRRVRICKSGTGFCAKDDFRNALASSSASLCKNFSLTGSVCLLGSLNKQRIALESKSSKPFIESVWYLSILADYLGQLQFSNTP